MKRTIKSILTLAAITIMSYNVNAQPGFDDEVDDVPVDGGITLLMAAGAVYGIKNRWDSYKKKSNL
jgi:hypothetical protein